MDNSESSGGSDFVVLDNSHDHTKAGTTGTEMEQSSFSSNGGEGGGSAMNSNNNVMHSSKIEGADESTSNRAVQEKSFSTKSLSSFSKKGSKSNKKTSGGSSSQGSATLFQMPAQRFKCSMSRTVMLRTLLIISLMAAVSLCVSLSYIKLRDTERQVGIQTYESIASSALFNAQQITLRKFQGSEVMSTLMGSIFPNNEDWPFIHIDRYIEISEKVAVLSSSSTQALMVIIDPSQREAIEEHAKETYVTQGRPPETGYSDFGFGIWKPDPNMTFEDGRAHDLDGTTSWGGELDIMIPLLYHNQPDAGSILYNVYSEEDRGIHIDSMYDCIAQAAASGMTTSPECVVITDMLELKIRPGPASLLFQPIYPVNNPQEFVGFATTSLHWQEVLENVVPDYVSGLTCIISTDTSSFTYEIKNGFPELVGDGDDHDNKYESYARNVILNNVTTGADSAATFTLTIYPTDQMFNAFATDGPMVVAVGFFAAITGCALIFIMYDFLMRRENYERRAILEMKRKFVRFISHEIRTPLNTVCMGLELLESDLHAAGMQMPEGEGGESKEGGEGAVTAEDVGFWHNVILDMNENAYVAVSILNDLLNYDKLETGTMNLETNTVFIWDLVERTVNQFRIQAVNRKVDMQLRIEPPEYDPVLFEDDPEEPCAALGFYNVVGDDVRLGQVLRNVISNALKFTPPDGVINVSARHIVNGLPHAKPMVVDGERELTHHARAGAVEIRIKDSGVGLTPEQLKLLFGEGIQFDANRLQHGGGSGLGLSIAKGIVEQHSGTIHAESRGTGHGTTFVVVLPLHEFTLGEIRQAVANQDQDLFPKLQTETIPEEGSDSFLPQVRRIVVAEDAASSRKMLIRLLERAGHTCIPAANGKEALDLIRDDMKASKSNPKHEHIDTVLMDYEMPVLKGPEATLKIRQLGYTGHILGITGNVLEEDVEFFRSHGANEVLAKPIRLDRIKSYWERGPADHCKKYQLDESTNRIIEESSRRCMDESKRSY